MAVFQSDVRARITRISHTMTMALEVSDLVLTYIGIVMHGIVNSDVGLYVGVELIDNKWWDLEPDGGLYFSYFTLALSQKRNHTYNSLFLTILWRHFKFVSWTTRTFKSRIFEAGL